MAGIRDIARRAGVSATTVSHVLNKSRYVHPDTIERVLNAVNELGYKPNMIARSLRCRKTNTIGLLISDIEGPYFAELAKAVETTAYERGFNTILCNTDENIEKEIAYFDVLFAKQIDGLILAPSPGDHTFLCNYIDKGAHIVCVNRYLPGLDCPSVVGDDEEAMYRLTDKLITNGHTRIGVLLGLENISTTNDRLKGVKAAVEAHGLAMEDVWVIPAQSRRDGGYCASKEYLRLGEKPTGIISFNCLMHDGFLLGLCEEDASLVNNIAIYSFGYSPVGWVIQKGYWYIAQPAYEIGKTAVNVLLDSFGESNLVGSSHIVVKNELFGPTTQRKERAPLQI